MNHLTTIIDKASVTALCADAISELERAARLHPKWPVNLHYHDEEHEEDSLKIERAINDHGRATGSSIFSEEFLEFLQAARKPGNQIAARAELVQAMAMLLRIGCHLCDYVEKAKSEKVEVKSGLLCPVDEEKCDQCAGVRDEPCPDATRKISNCPICGQQPVVSPGQGPMNSILCMGPDDAVHSRVGTGNHFEMLGAECQWEAIVRDVTATQEVKS